MKNVYEVMQQSQEKIERLQKEIELLRTVIPMLQEDEPLRAVSPVTNISSGPTGR
jgi:peptidoglycan hydrolase CwlO-like protein